MDTFLNFSLFFNVLGIFLSFIAITIVAHAARMVVGYIRRGLLSFLWGLSFLLLSFFYSILRFEQPDLPDMQSFIMALGMILILFSAKKLFSSYKPL